MVDPVFGLEKQAVSAGKVIAGIDEVGRGCIAGPVYAAIVLITSGQAFIRGVKDSKKLSRNERQRLSIIIKRNCFDYAIGKASVREIDKWGIGKATAKAMERAYKKVKCSPDVCLVDGARITRPSIPCEMIKNGDNIHYSIAAASIVAKVTRDRYMHRLAKKYPGYGFEHNVGYGTLEHRMAVKKYGFTDVHRRTFSPVKDLVN